MILNRISLNGDSDEPIENKEGGGFIQKHISGANVIGLQNEQLANGLGFDEETFNYPPVEKNPLLFKANLSLLAISLAQRPVSLTG